MVILYIRGFTGGLLVKNLSVTEGDLGLIPWLGRSPGEGNGYPLQYSCLENPMERGAWWATVFAVTRSWIHLVTQQEQLYTSRDFQALTCAR